MRTITTRQGDTWDLLAKRLYDNELYMSELIKANFAHRFTVVFSAGVVLNAPEIDTTDRSGADGLPPWKR